MRKSGVQRHALPRCQVGLHMTTVPDILSLSPNLVINLYGVKVIFCRKKALLVNGSVRCVFRLAPHDFRFVQLQKINGLKIKRLKAAIAGDV